MIETIRIDNEKKYIFTIKDNSLKDSTNDLNSGIIVSRCADGIKIKRLNEEINIPIFGYDIENFIEMILEVKEFGA